MKLRILTLAFASAALGLTAYAAPINAKFSDYPGAPVGIGALDLDTVAANTWFNDHYGITFQNAYLYADSRDTFDGLGVANDSASPVAKIFFADGTNFVTVDWLTVNSQDIYLDAYDINNVLVDSFFHGAGSGTVTLHGTDIRSLVFHDGGGQVGLSSLSYDFDGTTDGTNTDISVPDSGATLGLLAGSLGLVAFFRRRRA
jgi:hypothetical protein